MAENSQEDDFDIDIYGDGDGYQQEKVEEEIKSEAPKETTMQPPEPAPDPAISDKPNGQGELAIIQGKDDDGKDVAQKIASTDQSASDHVYLPKQAPQTQGLKRKDGEDDRIIDPGATTALFVSELHWWVNDDDVRGWANQSECEDELLEITFSEHKVNGKSKGQAYILFKSPQAATSAKHKVESFGEGQQYSKKFTVSYTNPYTNPFKTLPKDGPMRNNIPASNNRSNSGAYGGTSSQSSGYNNNSNYRGNRGGGYSNRGAMNNMGGFNRGGFQQSMAGGFQSGVSGFQGAPIGNMQSYGGFQNRGAMAGGMRGGPMGVRGGRGGMNGMMGMPMTEMGIGAMNGMGMGMGMGMAQMNAGMGLQGMPGSYSRPSSSPIQPHKFPTIGPLWTGPSMMQRAHASASPAGSYGHAAPMIGPQLPPRAGRARSSSTSSGGAGATALMANGHPSSAWASYTEYSPSTASISFVYSSIPAASSLNQTSQTLKFDSSPTGTQPHFNPAFFPQQQLGQQSPAGDANWNPHGAKRTRQE